MPEYQRVCVECRPIVHPVTRGRTPSAYDARPHARAIHMKRLPTMSLETCALSSQ